MLPEQQFKTLYLSIYPPMVHPSIHPSIHPPIHPSIHPSNPIFCTFWIFLDSAGWVLGIRNPTPKQDQKKNTSSATTTLLNMLRFLQGLRTNSKRQGAQHREVVMRTKTTTAPTLRRYSTWWLPRQPRERMVGAWALRFTRQPSSSRAF